MRQEQIYSERRNSLISAPARSHAIFAFKNLGIEIQAIQQVYSLKTSFGDFDLTGNSDFKNSIRYYYSGVLVLGCVKPIFGSNYSFCKIFEFCTIFTFLHSSVYFPLCNFRFLHFSFHFAHASAKRDPSEKVEVARPKADAENCIPKYEYHAS